MPRRKQVSPRHRCEAAQHAPFLRPSKPKSHLNSCSALSRNRLVHCALHGEGVFPLYLVVKFFSDSPRIGIRRKHNGPYYCVSCAFRRLLPGAEASAPKCAGALFLLAMQTFCRHRSLPQQPAATERATASASRRRGCVRFRYFSPLMVYSPFRKKDQTVSTQLDAWCSAAFNVSFQEGGKARRPRVQGAFFLDGLLFYLRRTKPIGTNSAPRQDKPSQSQ